MNDFVPWNSQSLTAWSHKYAAGEFVDLAGRSTHYLERGTGEPVILLHGFNMDANTWKNNIDALALNYKVYAIDLWGLGFSHRESIDPGYELYSEQLLRFMDEKGIHKATLVGHSMGGGTAIFFAVNHANRVEKLVLVDSTGIPNPLPLRSKFFTLPGLGEFLLSINNDYFRRKNLGELWFFDRDQMTNEVYETITQFQKIEGSSEILLKILRKDFFHTLREKIHQLDQLDVPVLIIWGEHDISIPLKIGEEMHSMLEGSRFEIIEHGGHMPNFDDPDRFNQIVGDFLEGSLLSSASVSRYRDSALPLNDPAQPSLVR
jgi:pimeloyl-ACP methyl ester carboxylesterase